jgi:hypothetical protein
MNTQRFITAAEIQAVAEDMRGDLEINPLSHHRKVELATELATEAFGFTPRRSVILLIVKQANLNWHATKVATRRELSRPRPDGRG